MYTASSTQLRPASIKPLDHPYAAWLYGGVFKETYQADGSHLNVGLDFGCIGPCAGGEAMQTTYHRLMHRKLPRGWSTQVRNELGGVLYGDVGWKRWTLAPWLDLAPGLLGRFGNIHTDASGVATLRFGALNALPGQSTLHGFLRGEVRAVAYDALLQGGYFSSNNAHTVKPKSVTGELELGVAWNKPPFAVRASIVKRASEIREMSNAAGSQNFMRLQFTYAP